MHSAVQGNEMKIQKVFEAFEQFRLGEETLAQLVTRLEASLIQVTMGIIRIKERRWCGNALFVLMMKISCNCWAGMIVWCSRPL